MGGINKTMEINWHELGAKSPTALGALALAKANNDNL